MYVCMYVYCIITDTRYNRYYVPILVYVSELPPSASGVPAIVIDKHPGRVPIQCHRFEDNSNSHVIFF